MRVGVFGTGRFGSFWAQVLARHATVVTYTRNRERPAPEGCTAVSIKEFAGCDAVMLCVAISAVPEAMKSLRAHLVPGVTLLDTCSVKVFPVQQMLGGAPEHTSVLGTHPMFGPDSAREGVRGLPIVLSPARCSREELEHWSQFFSRMGLEVLVRSPQEHDREAAMTQGVTHFLGRVLAELDLIPSEMATVGYQKLLEVVEQTCNDPYQLFLDLQRYNPYTSEMRARLRESLGRVRQTLEGNPPADALAEDKLDSGTPHS